MTDNLPATSSGSDLATLDDNDLIDFLATQKTDDFKAGDKVVPWLVLVQSSGGYMKRGKPNYNPDAREGDITDNLSGRLRAQQTVILCKFEQHYTTWKPKGGPLVRQHFTDPTAWNAAKYPEGRTYGNKEDADGNEVRASNVYYILAVDTETGVFEPMVWSLSSTQFGKAKKINSLATAMMQRSNGSPFVPPIYARLFDLTSAIEHGDEDKSWAGWVYNVGDAVLSHKYGRMWTMAAIKFREEIEAGHVRPALPETDGYADADEDSSPRSRDSGDQGRTIPDTEEIPF